MNIVVGLIPQRVPKQIAFASSCRAATGGEAVSPVSVGKYEEEDTNTTFALYFPGQKNKKIAIFLAVDSLKFEPSGKYGSHEQLTNKTNCSCSNKTARKAFMTFPVMRLNP
ncbi:hypothetical protein [Komagataeibacter melaceti]|uniref:hypothetical protein n=1 Tax=Komagataeibacter melaceti TaxID=2766577 RepID=UPI0011E58B36|nr:hypothetical protein [Komagataeibacter melaceti]